MLHRAETRKDLRKTTNFDRLMCINIIGEYSLTYFGPSGRHFKTHRYHYFRKIKNLLCKISHCFQAGSFFLYVDKSTVKFSSKSSSLTGKHFVIKSVFTYEMFNIGNHLHSVIHLKRIITNIRISFYYQMFTLSERSLGHQDL